MTPFEVPNAARKSPHYCKNYEATPFFVLIEERQGTKFGYIEEVAYLSKFIDREQLLALAAKLEKFGYGEYLKRIAN